MANSLEDYLEMFNNGELDVHSYFNSYDTWFNILKKRGLMSEIDPNNAVEGQVWENEYLLWLYDNDRENYYKWVSGILGDIEIDPTTKEVYWVGNREDLADLFCSKDRDFSQDTVRSILSDDGDWWEPYWDTTDNVYRDVVEELNPKNLEHLKEVILKELEGIKLTPETEEMELISAEQGHNDYWEMNSDSVSRIIDDEKSMNSLFKDELTDLKSELYQVHSNAYNSAHQDDIYESVWNELGDYFDGQGEWVTKPHPFKKDTMVQKFKVPIKDFSDIVNDYLYNNKGYGNSGTLEYQGSFIQILKEEKDCLSPRFPDYPDFRKVDKNINEYFSDYIS